MSVLNVTPAAHAAVKAAAETAGVSMTSWASERLTASGWGAPRASLVTENNLDGPWARMRFMQIARGDASMAETLTAALDALEPARDPSLAPWERK